MLADVSDRPSTREEWVSAIRGFLGQMIESGEAVDEDDFNEVKRQYLDGASDAERAVIDSITWDEVHADLWE
jgi:hypothetical protein